MDRERCARWRIQPATTFGLVSWVAEQTQAFADANRAMILAARGGE